MEYRVLVDDNLHPYDEDERYTAGVFATEEEALGAARRMVVESVCASYEQGMSPASLYDSYLSFGGDPFVSPKGSIGFSAWNYAESIAPVVCGVMEHMARRRDRAGGHAGSNEERAGNETRG